MSLLSVILGIKETVKIIYFSPSYFVDKNGNERN